MSKYSKKIPPGALITEGGNNKENPTGLWSQKVAVVDHEKCIKCHICAGYCPEGCISVLENGKDVEVDGFFCKGCGVCAKECPVRAIKLKNK